jgi:murein DD-endopeptidase / murein LD-carboxypeptidase
MKSKITLSLLFLASFSLEISAKGQGELTEKSTVDREQQQLEWCFVYSNLFGYNISYINNPRLYKITSEWMGTPYKYSGSSKKGIDCSGLVCEVYRDCYSKNIEGSAKDIFKNSIEVPKSDLREGDLVFFKIRKNKVSHVGIYLGQNKFVHASVQQGVVISDLNDPYYQRYFFKGGRIKL